MINNGIFLQVKKKKEPPFSCMMESFNHLFLLWKIRHKISNIFIYKKSVPSEGRGLT